MRSLNLMLGALLLAGCAATSERPESSEGIEGRSAKYPEARYFTGHGQGESAGLARDRARSDLIKVFEAQIAEESRDQSSATRESRGGETSLSSSQKVERNVNVTTARTVEGIQIAEVWEEKKSGTWHALATLDRLKAGEGLRTEINQRDEITARELGIARGSDDMLAQITSALRATEAQRQRTALQRDLRVLDPTGVGVPPRWELAQLESDLAQLSKRLKLSTRAEQDPVGNLETVLAGAVARAGFTHVTAEGAPYQLSAALALDESVSGGWNWAKGNLSLTLKDAAGNVRGTRQWPIKASAQQATVARQRAMGEVDRILRAQLRDAVLGIAAK